MKVLECSTEGDTRFSALVAKVNIGGELKTIEEHYQGAKRFRSVNTSFSSAKGMQPDWLEIFGVKLPLKELSNWYYLLWYYYFLQNKGLLKVIESYDAFNDTHRGNSVNCQADVIHFIRYYGLKELEQLIVKPFEVRFEYYQSKQKNKEQ